MKRVLNLLLVLGFLALLLYPYSYEACAARRGTILDFFNGKDIIRTYVSDVVNSSGDDKLDAKDLKISIEDALSSRLSHAFEIVSDTAEADIIIYAEIVDYLWTEQDPVDMVTGLPGLAYDAAVKEHYARMDAVFTIINAKDGAQLWQEKLMSTVTDPTMTEEESYDLSNEKMAKVFMRNLLKKPKRGSRL